MRIQVNGKTVDVEGNNVQIVNDKVYVDGKLIDLDGAPPKNRIMEVRILEGSVGELKVDGNVSCLGVTGSVKANTVNCGNVGGDVKANVVTCGSIAGGVNANMVTRRD